uniref:Secreted protein n=1 Tax=Physcomitrium patens TaxID=3218 RepID=A0A2K1L8R7_PHYPA|nr:hypothetical protein PHYPA_000862 [Physcomitrium patens]
MLLRGLPLLLHMLAMDRDQTLAHVCRPLAMVVPYHGVHVRFTVEPPGDLTHGTTISGASSVSN